MTRENTMSNTDPTPTNSTVPATESNSDEQIALFIYGLPGAGKSTVLDVADEYDIPNITMGEVVRKRAAETLGDDFTSSELGQWASNQRAEHGSTIMAEYTLEEITGTDAPVIIIEGTRSPDEIRVFAAQFRTLTLRVDAPYADRLHRLQDRGRDGEDTFTPEDLHDRDSREMVEWGLGDLYATDDPDYVIENTGTLTQYREIITDILDSLS